MSVPIEWLLEGPPWVQYRARLDLLQQPEDEPQVRAARQAMLAHPQVQGILTELAGWPGAVLNSHKSASQPFHKLAFVADLGLHSGDPGVDAIVARIVQRQSAEGPFQLPMNISVSHGGTGEERWAWALCDAPTILYALARFGLAEDARVRRGIQHVAGLARENGWPCAVAPELGKFRGPGRKEDPCPYATLIMLKALALYADWRDSPATRAGCEALLTLWAQSWERHPYIFYMGTDFRKLKAPTIWYDIVHVLDMLTQFPWVRQDSRLRAMLDVVGAKADAEGRFTPESVWSAWKGWDFGQKRVPSRWLTLLVQRILRRVET